MINTHDIDADDFKSSFPVGAAHAASEVDDYESSTPEGGAIAVLFVASCLIAAIAVLMVVL